MAVHTLSSGYVKVCTSMYVCMFWLKGRGTLCGGEWGCASWMAPPPPPQFFLPFFTLFSSLIFQLPTCSLLLPMYQPPRLQTQVCIFFNCTVQYIYYDKQDSKNRARYYDPTQGQKGGAVTRPFSPMLCEAFGAKTGGFRFLAEKVGHKMADGRFTQSPMPTQQFLGSPLNLTPLVTSI